MYANSLSLHDALPIFYTHRHYSSDQDLFRAFQDEKGIRVNVVNASADELIQKMIMEGEQSPADVLITVDAGRLERATSNDLLQPIESDILDRSEEHTSELQSRGHLVCRLLL